MSVLEFPRLYFQGYISWDPATGNNDDYGPVYDAQNCVLNYAAMGAGGADLSAFGVDSAAFGASARAWMVRNSVNGAMGAEWNYFGGNGVRFIQHDEYRTTVVGGVMPDGSQIGTGDDEVVGATIELSGDTPGSPGRLVDCVSQTTSTTIVFAKRLTIAGDSGSTGGSLVAPMHSLFLGTAGLSASFQTTIAKADFGAWSSSRLVSAFTDAFGDNDVLGVTVRMLSAASTFGKGNGVFNSIPDYSDDLAGNYSKALSGEIPFFSSPAQSRVLGVVGLWRRGEATTMSSDRRLVPTGSLIDPGTGRAVPPPGSLPPSPPPFGVAHALVHKVGEQWKLSVDLANAFGPAKPHDPTTTIATESFSISTVGLEQRHGAHVADISKSVVDDAFVHGAGIVDVDIDDPPSARLQVESSGANPTVWAEEDRFIAVANVRDGYVSAGDVADIEISVFESGKAAPKGVLVRVLQFAQPGPWLDDTFLLTEDGPEGGAEFLSGTPMSLQYQGADPGPASVPATVLTVGENGTALLRFRACTLSPIFVFQPYMTDLGGGLPAIPDFNVGTAMFASRRCYPDDRDVVQRFCNLWNSGISAIEEGSPEHDAKKNALWNFLYFEVLVLYDVLYPMMRRYFAFGDRTAMEGNIETVLALVDRRLFDEQSTTYMPITRDLSDGKRDVIKLWAGRVRAGYALDVIDPCDAAGIAVEWRHPPF